MISLNSICLDFGAFRLLDNVSFLINKNDKLGLTGRNGAGKTTLLKLINSMISPSSGIIQMPKDIKIGYLPQEKTFDGDVSVFNETMKAFSKVIEIRKEIHEIQNSLENNAAHEQQDLMKLFDRLNEINERYTFLEGDTVEMRVERVLMGLGFERHEFHNALNTFSEGWQMRVELAKILLQQTDILLLDEPTNHLDIESIQWLEDYLIAYKGAVVLISHDRMFLDKVTRRTIEINFARIYDYPVSYSKYVELRDERIEQQKKVLDARQKEVAQIEKFISRFRYKATKAKQVQSRVKQLEKMDKIQVDELNVSEISFRFPDCKPSGKIVIECENLCKSYGTKNVISNLGFIISMGQKIAFLGKNGQGKTTLSRIIADGLDYKGHLKQGYNVVIGYFPQNAGKFLNTSLTVLETAEQEAHVDFRARVRSVLGNFLFCGDDVHKKVSVLSGGEKSRLSLVILMCRPSNFLVLDEPTNHLDMISKEVLKYALINYKGTVVIVSHDRNFLEGLTNMVFYFNQQQVKQYPGTVNEFLHLKKLSNMKELEKQNKKTKKDPGTVVRISENKQKWEVQKEQERAKRKLKTRIENLEKEIEEYEKLLSQQEELLNSVQHNDVTSIFEQYQRNKKRLDELFYEWDVLQSEMKEYLC